MKPELEQELFKRYPEIFGEDFGIECGDGWFNIINKLCAEIQSHVNFAKCSQVVAEQVKEKFGTLRFYHSGGDQYIAGLVTMAEAMTEVTCEVCGDTGTRRGGSWIKTLCNTHYVDRELARSGHGTS